MIFFVLEYAPLAMPKAPYPSMESTLIPIFRYVKTSFSACTSTESTAVHFSSQNHTPVLFPRIQFCFLITQLDNSNCIINWNVSTSNSTSTSISQPVEQCEFCSLVREISLCNAPHWAPVYVMVL